MKKLFFCVLVVLFFANPASLKAELVQHSLHVEWGYTPSSNLGVKGFNLYQEGVRVAQLSGANLIEADVLCTLTAQLTKFTLTAAFVDGTESPHSNPFIFDASKSRPATAQDFELLSMQGIKIAPGTTLRVATVKMGSSKG